MYYRVVSTVRKSLNWPQTFLGTSSCQWERVLESLRRPLSSACTSQLWISWRPMQRWPWAHLISIICIFAAIICIPPSLLSSYRRTERQSKYVVKWPVLFCRASIWIDVQWRLHPWVIRQSLNNFQEEQRTVERGRDPKRLIAGHPHSPLVYVSS